MAKTPTYTYNEVTEKMTSIMQEFKKDLNEPGKTDSEIVAALKEKVNANLQLLMLATLFGALAPTVENEG